MLGLNLSITIDHPVHGEALPLIRLSSMVTTGRSLIACIVYPASCFHLLALKNPCIISRHSRSSTPETTAIPGCFPGLGNTA